MFTGIIRAVSPVISVVPRNGNLVAQIETPANWELSLGQSIAVDGVCSTVTNIGPGFFEVVWIPETIAKTTVGSYTAGSKVNLERSLTLQDFVDGHIVQGHVDSRAKVAQIATEDGATRVTVEVPTDLTQFIAQKGSICINGVSLTVAAKDGPLATVALIPYTLEHTNLGLLKEGDMINLEVDMIARYLAARNP